MNIIIFLLFSTVSAFGQSCFETDLKIKEIETETQYLEFVMFYENDSIKKICWWIKGTFRAEIYNRKEIIRTQIIKEQPSEYNSGEITYRGHALRGDLYIDGKKLEFYTLCD